MLRFAMPCACEESGAKREDYTPHPASVPLPATDARVSTLNQVL